MKPRHQVGASRRQLRDEVAAYVRELIISGQARAGTPVRLGQLANNVGASVTPVREALLLLAQDGWVVQEPNRGFHVALITRDDVSDAYLIQSIVAGELAARGANNVVADAVGELWRLDAQIAQLEITKDYREVEELNYRLHEVIYDLAASPRLTWFVLAASRFVPRQFWATIPGWLEHNRAGHKPVISAVADGDAERARDAMAHHIATAGDLLIRHLDSTGFWSIGEAARL
jgi:DNA-binding GntR family transcriptional regulator